MLGDLSLAGFPIKAQVLAARPGHASNIEFAKKLRSAWKKKAPLRKYKKQQGGPVLDIDALMKIMPHRYPFLLIDKVLEFDQENNSITAIKNVTINEPFFQGHFPIKPVMPGVLICESMAQAGCLLILEESSDFSNKLVVFSGIKNAKFRKPVVPGDQLVLTAKITGKKLGTYVLQVNASVNGQVVAEAELSTSMITLKN
jgi:UDP-3-O-[3-hydroxymyristoyl] N-acetylglucosamine deacetylase/3-hydroxyacyl-[acyl-carrier-protein] dehydratase